jgi:phosphatidylinositol alpha-1,6-mannosyltransferase
MISKKRLLISTSFINPSAGGIQNTGYLFSKAFSLYFDLVFVVSASGSVSINSKVIDGSFKSNNIQCLLYNIKEVHREWKNNKISYCLSLSWRTAIIPFLFSIIYKVPYGVMMHGNEIMDKNNTSLKNIFENKIRKIVLSHSKDLFANSNYTAGLAKKVVNNKSINIIHPPLEKFNIKGSPLHRKNRTVFSIGRLEYRKGFQLVIEAIEVLVSKYSDIEYRIAGDGPYRVELEKLIKKKNLGMNIIMLGRIDEAQKIKEYQQASVVVMPSFVDESNSSVEGFGIVFIEANAFGCPVIGTNSGGIPDAIKNEKTGWIIQEKNVHELELAIEKAFLNCGTNISKQCIAWAKLYEYPNIVNKYCEIIGL